MKKWMIHVLFWALIFSGSSRGQDWQAVYQTDFSSDPGWITNNADHFYWDSSNEAYFLHGERALTPWEYAYKPVRVGGSFKLEYDAYITHLPWAGDFNLGLLSENLHRAPGAVYLTGIFENPDEGRGIGVNYANLEGTRASHHNYDPLAYELNQWYHAELKYDAETAEIDFTTFRKSDGGNLRQVHVDNAGTFFPSGMKNLGVSMQGLTPYGGGYAEGLIDNLKLSITQSLPQIRSPVTGDAFVAGSEQKIEWLNCLCQDPNVILEYSFETDPNWILIAVTDNDGEFVWAVPELDSQHCLVRITAQNHPEYYDVSDDFFTIFICHGGPIPGDTDGDCYVNLRDFALLVNNWLRCGNKFDPRCVIQ